MFALFVSLLVVAEFVAYALVVGLVLVSGGRFLGSGLVGGVGRCKRPQRLPKTSPLITCT